MSTHPIINIATRAARRAGDVILRHADRIDSLTVSSKAYNDFVSEVDRQAEQEIIEILRKAYPDYGILAEESGQQRADADYLWVIDPLDGTTNFLHGFPQYAISIALMHKGQVEHGVIYDPVRRELFAASRGAGAVLNDRRLRVTKRKGLAGSLLGTGFPYKDHQHLDTYLATFKALCPRCAGIRRAGAASLDLAYVAAGRLDGFWEMDLSKWDIAAGVLIVREAGGIITDFGGDQGFLDSGNIIAGSPKVHHELIATILPELPASLRC